MQYRIRDNEVIQTTETSGTIQNISDAEAEISTSADFTDSFVLRGWDRITFTRPLYIRAREEKTSLIVLNVLQNFFLSKSGGSGEGLSAEDKNALSQAFKAAKTEGNTVSFFTDTDTTGTAAFSFNFPEEIFLNQLGTEIVENFSWSALAYPNSTNPNLNGRTVFVLAVKGDKTTNPTIKYSFVSMEKLVDIYTASDTSITINGYKVSVQVSAAANNALTLKNDGLHVDISGKVDTDALQNVWAYDSNTSVATFGNAFSPPLITVRNVTGTDNLGISGNNVTVKAAGNYIVDGAGYNFYITPNSTTLTAVSNNTTLSAKATDYLTNRGHGCTIIQLSSMHALIAKNSGNDTQIIGGNATAQITLEGGCTNCTVSTGGGVNYVRCSAGYNTFYTGTGSTTFVYGGGHDIFYDFKETDIINLESGDSVEKVSISGGNLLATVNHGGSAIANAVTIVGAQDKAIQIGDKRYYNNTLIYSTDKKAVSVQSAFGSYTLTSADYDSAVVTIDSSNKSLSRISGNANNNVFVGVQGGVVHGGEGNNIFYASNKSYAIDDFDDGDKISISAGYTFKDNDNPHNFGSSHTWNGSDTCLRFATTDNQSVAVGVITVKGSADITINAGGRIFYNDLVYSSDKKQVGILQGGKTTLNAADYDSAVVTITGNYYQGCTYGNSNNNTFYLPSVNSIFSYSIIGGSGNNTVHCAPMPLSVNNITLGGGTNHIYDYHKGSINFDSGITVKNCSLSGSNLNVTLDNNGTQVNNGLTIYDVKDTPVNIAGNIYLNNYKYSSNYTTLTAGAANNTILADNYDDRVTIIDASSRTAATFIEGNQNNNTIIGGSGADVLLGGEGNDCLVGGTGNDILRGGEGANTLVAGAGNNTLYGGSGANTYVYGGGKDSIYGYASNELITLQSGYSIVNTALASNNVYVTVSSGSDTINNAITIYNAKDMPMRINTKYYLNGAVKT